MRTFENDTLGETWIDILSCIMRDGEEINDDDQRLKEVRNIHARIEKLDEQDAILKRHADKDRIALMKEKYATCGLVGDYKIDYGSYIYDNNGVDQIDWVIRRIRRKPETKSATIGLHVAGEEMLACLSLLDFKLREGRLELNAVYRSQNAFASLPGNMLALRSIQSDVAEGVGVELGAVNLTVFSSHVYEKDYASVLRILSQIDCECTDE